MSADAVFAALSDPTRRRLVERLARGRAASATRLARDLPIAELKRILDGR